MKNMKEEKKILVNQSVFECIHCNKFFDCKLDHTQIDRCVNFEERRSDNGRKKNVYKENN